MWLFASNIVISRIFSAYFLGLPLISAANAEEDWAFFGDSGGQNRHFPKRRKGISRRLPQPRKLLDQRVKALLARLE
jgi:hypothetical protein